MVGFDNQLGHKRVVGVEATRNIIKILIIVYLTVFFLNHEFDFVKQQRPYKIVPVGMA